MYAVTPANTLTTISSQPAGFSVHFLVQLPAPAELIHEMQFRLDTFPFVDLFTAIWPNDYHPLHGLNAHCDLRCPHSTFCTNSSVDGQFPIVAHHIFTFRIPKYKRIISNLQRNKIVLWFHKKNTFITSMMFLTDRWMTLFVYFRTCFFFCTKVIQRGKVSREAAREVIISMDLFMRKISCTLNHDLLPA